jgi:amidophosphoribosyltransferase
LRQLTGSPFCCDACFTGHYPTTVPSDLRKDRFERKLTERKREVWEKQGSPSHE